MFIDRRSCRSYAIVYARCQHWSGAQSFTPFRRQSLIESKSMSTTSTIKGSIACTSSCLLSSAYETTLPDAHEHRPALVVICHFQTDRVRCQTGCGTALHLPFLAGLVCIGCCGCLSKFGDLSSLYKMLGYYASDSICLCRRRSITPLARSLAQDRGLPVSSTRIFD